MKACDAKLRGATATIDRCYASQAAKGEELFRRNCRSNFRLCLLRFLSDNLEETLSTGTRSLTRSPRRRVFIFFRQEAPKAPFVPPGVFLPACFSWRVSPGESDSRTRRDLCGLRISSLQVSQAYLSCNIFSESPDFKCAVFKFFDPLQIQFSEPLLRIYRDRRF